MAQVRGIARVLVVIPALLFFASTAAAWEFSLGGCATYSFLYYAQQGPMGFFGPYDVDNSADLTILTVNPVTGQKPTLNSVITANAATDFAPANAWLGLQVAGVTSASAASRSFWSTLLLPKLTVNRAINLEGTYRIGNTDTATFPGATVSFANGEWLQWWTTIQLPWGLVVYGKRPFAFGCGFQYDVGNRTEEYLTLSANTGPVTIGLGLYPWRRGRQFLNQSNREEVYWNIYDTNGVPSSDLFGFVQYESGRVAGGFGGTFAQNHYGPEGFTTAAARASMAALDTTDSEGWIFFKYNDGLLFFNAEADWYYKYAKFHRSSDGNFLTADGDVVADTTDGSGSLFQPKYTEAWRIMTQFGFFAGPAKATFLYAWVPGPDRRHGVLIDRQPVQVDLYRPYRDVVIQNPDLSNSSLFQPFSLLLNTAFGAGVGAFSFQTVSRAANGYMTDASMFGLRLDYAVAANLNLYASAFHARRVSHGYGWGFIYLDRNPADITRFDVLFERTRNYTTPVPAIPDNDLGWEVNAGFDWGLLEGLIFRFAAGYWQPGRWFNYACIDKNVPRWNYFESVNSWGAMPDRPIDPVVALNWSVGIAF